MEKELEERELKELELMNENENREFYVYVHIRLDNNTVFYVGKGTKNRAYNLDRGNFHNCVCKKYGCRVEIIKDGLTESQAFRLESKMIKYYVITLGYGIPIDGYRDYSNNKYLTNFTWGGEGVSGMHHSEESKEKMRQSHIGKKQSEETRRKRSESMKGIQFSEERNRKISESSKGKKMSDEAKRKLSKKNKGKKASEYTKRKMSKARKGKKHSEEHNKKISEAKKGIKFSEEHKKNLSESHKGKPAPNRSKVICITTGVTFDSITDASNHYNVSRSSIPKCCKGKQKSAGKLNGVPLQWKYSEDDDNESKAV